MQAKKRFFTIIGFARELGVSRDAIDHWGKKGLANLPPFLIVFLSGVFTPVLSLPPILRQIAYVLPLTHTVDGIRQAFSNAGMVDILVLIALIPILILPAARLLAKRFT